MIKWAIELSKLGIKYDAWTTLKAQVFVDFMEEMTSTIHTKPPDLLWTINLDGCSNNKGSGVCLIVENRDKLVVEVSLRFSFTTSNNQDEYKACIVGLLLARGLQRPQSRGPS